MGMAMFVAFLHGMLHARVWYWFNSNSATNGDEEGGDCVAEEEAEVRNSVKRYAIFTTAMNTLEMINWGVGMTLPLDSTMRGWIFLFGIVLNLRLPRSFMPNDFHGKLQILFRVMICDTSATHAYTEHTVAWSTQLHAQSGEYYSSYYLGSICKVSSVWPLPTSYTGILASTNTRSYSWHASYCTLSNYFMWMIRTLYHPKIMPYYTIEPRASAFMLETFPYYSSRQC